MNPSNAIRKLEQMDAVHPDGQNIVLDRTDLTVKTLTATGVTNAGTVSNTGAVTNSSTVTTAGATVHTGGNQTLMIATPDTAYAVLAANSGKIHLVTNVSADRIYTLPTAAAGLYYEFWSTLDAADGHDVQIVAAQAADFYIGSLMWTDSDLTVGAVINDPDNATDHTLNILLPIAFNIKMYCDGTNWYISGWTYAAAAPTWT